MQQLFAAESFTFFRYIIPTDTCLAIFNNNNNNNYNKPIRTEIRDTNWSCLFIHNAGYVQIVLNIAVVVVIVIVAVISCKYEHISVRASSCRSKYIFYILHVGKKIASPQLKAMRYVSVCIAIAYAFVPFAADCRSNCPVVYSFFFFYFGASSML